MKSWIAVLVLFATVMLWGFAGCLVPAKQEAPPPEENAVLSDSPEIRVQIPGTDKELLVTPEILDKYAEGAKATGDALPPPVGPIATYGGWGLAALAETWRRYDRKKKESQAAKKDSVANSLQSGLLSLTEGIETTLAQLDVTNPELAAKIRNTLDRVQKRRGVKDVINIVRSGGEVTAGGTVPSMPNPPPSPPPKHNTRSVRKRTRGPRSRRRSHRQADLPLRIVDCGMRIATEDTEKG